MDAELVEGGSRLFAISCTLTGAGAGRISAVACLTGHAFSSPGIEIQENGL